MLRVGEIVFTEESMPIGYPIPNSEPCERTYEEHYTGCIFVYRIYMYMYVWTINEKLGHEFEREQRAVYEKVWSQEREGIYDRWCNYIIISEIKEIFLRRIPHFKGLEVPKVKPNPQQSYQMV